MSAKQVRALITALCNSSSIAIGITSNYLALLLLSPTFWSSRPHLTLSKQGSTTTAARSICTPLLLRQCTRRPQKQPRRLFFTTKRTSASPSEAKEYKAAADHRTAKSYCLQNNKQQRRSLLATCPSQIKRRSIISQCLKSLKSLILDVFKHSELHFKAQCRKSNKKIH